MDKHEADGRGGKTRTDTHLNLLNLAKTQCVKTREHIVNEQMHFGNFLDNIAIK